MTQRTASPTTAPGGPPGARHSKRGRTPGRTAILLAAATGAALALTACGGADSGAGSGAGASGTSRSQAPSAGGGPEQDGGSTTSPGGEGTATGGAPGAPEGGAGQAGDGSRCAAGDLGLSLGRGEPGAGNIYYTLTFKNNGSSPCTLAGFPGVSLLKGDGSTIGKPADREGDPAAAVTLAAGGSAHVNLHTANEGVAEGGCWSAPAHLKVYPPGSKQSLTVSPGKLRVCGDIFTVTTISSGTM